MRVSVTLNEAFFWSCKKFSCRQTAMDHINNTYIPHLQLNKLTANATYQILTSTTKMNVHELIHQFSDHVGMTIWNLIFLYYKLLMWKHTSKIDCFVFCATCFVCVMGISWCLPNDVTIHKVSLCIANPISNFPLWSIVTPLPIVWLESIIGDFYLFHIFDTEQCWRGCSATETFSSIFDLVSFVVCCYSLPIFSPPFFITRSNTDFSILII